jgi:hypothetical protein
MSQRELSAAKQRGLHLRVSYRVGEKASGEQFGVLSLQMTEALNVRWKKYPKRAQKRLLGELHAWFRHSVYHGGSRP